MNFKRRTKIGNIWKKYEVTENGRISVFSMIERLKLVDAIIIKTINVNFVTNKKIIE
jgi:hypothetical protein